MRIRNLKNRTAARDKGGHGVGIVHGDLAGARSSSDAAGGAKGANDGERDIAWDELSSRCAEVREWVGVRDI